MRVHKLTFAALAVAAGLSLTACQNDEGSAGQSAPSSAPLSSSGSSASSSSTGGSGTSGASSDASSGSGGSAQGSGNDATGQNSGETGVTPGSGSGNGSSGSGKAGGCRTDDLAITATDNTIDGDPDRTVAVELKNRSGRDCVMSGYAGVDLKTNSGTISAKRINQRSSVTVDLKSGKSVDFAISYPFNKSGGSGVRITGLVVTPPDETHSVTLAWPGAATLPATDGTGSPVEVGPLGSAGQGG